MTPEGENLLRKKKKLKRLYRQDVVVTFIKKERLKWLGHVKRMSHCRVPKNVLYGKGGISFRRHPRIRGLDDAESGRP